MKKLFVILVVILSSCVHVVEATPVNKKPHSKHYRKYHVHGKKKNRNSLSFNFGPCPGC